MRQVLTFPEHLQEEVARGDMSYQFLVELDKNVVAKQKERQKERQRFFGYVAFETSQDAFVRKYKNKVESDVVDLRKVGTLFDAAKALTRWAKGRARRLLGWRQIRLEPSTMHTTLEPPPALSRRGCFATWACMPSQSARLAVWSPRCWPEAAGNIGASSISQVARRYSETGCRNGRRRRLRRSAHHPGVLEARVWLNSFGERWRNLSDDPVAAAYVFDREQTLRLVHSHGNMPETDAWVERIKALVENPILRVGNLSDRKNF